MELFTNQLQLIGKLGYLLKSRINQLQLIGRLGYLLKSCIDQNTHAYIHTQTILNVHIMYIYVMYTYIYNVCFTVFP